MKKQPVGAALGIGATALWLFGCHDVAAMSQAGSGPPDAISPAAALGRSPRQEPYVWRNVAIVAGGFVNGLLFHPEERGLIYAKTDMGGAYRWDDSAKRWMPLTDWASQTDWNLRGIESIGLDPSDPNRLYIAAGTYTSE